jgi:hypothetical protein
MGSLKIIKLRSGPSFRINSPGKDLELTEIYSVTWIPASDADVTPPADGAIFASASASTLSVRVPKVQERYIGSGAANCDANYQFLVCESVDWKPNQQVAHSWTATATFTSHMEFIYSDATAEPKPWTRITRTSNARNAPTFRVNVQVPGTYMWPPTTDIGGTKVDIQGQPVTRLIPQIQIVTEFKYDRTWTASPTTGDIQPEPHAEFFGWLGLRNSTKFLEMDPGFVLCNGISFSPVNDQVYIAQFRFLFDWMAFYEQRSAPNTGGANYVAPSSINFIGAPFLQATKVGWFQPYPETGDLTKMFPPAVYAAFLVALPAVRTGCGGFTAGLGRDLSARQFDYSQFPGAS